MPSQNFDYTKHIREITRKLHNERISDFFASLKDEKGNIIKVDDDSVSTSLASLKTACKIDTKDSLIMVQSKLGLFDLIEKHFSQFSSATELMYGTPVASYRQLVRFQPQISIELLEPYPIAKKEQRSPLKTSITFRLADKTAESITESDLLNYAKNIKQAFTLGDEPKKYNKGATQYCYRDEDKGYRLRLLVEAESDGYKLLQDILSVQQHTFDEKNVNISESKKRPGSRPKEKFVLNEWRTLPQYRPTANVYFRRAWIDIWEMGRPIMLCQFKRERLITYSGD